MYTYVGDNAPSEIVPSGPQLTVIIIMTGKEMLAILIWG